MNKTLLWILIAASVFIPTIFTGIYIFQGNKTKGSEGEKKTEIKRKEPTIKENEVLLPDASEPIETIQTEDETIPEPEQSQPTEPPDLGGPATAANWWDYPANISNTTRSGDDLLVLVNKSYKLPAEYGPSDLTDASNSGIRTTASISIRNTVIGDLHNLGAAANSDGIDLSIISGYRSYATQESTYNYWVNYNGGNASAADQISARAGHSQHQLGTALDFSTSEIGDRIGSEFNTTSAAQWLANNAWKYGFVIAYPAGWEPTTGYAYESWHYRYIGVSNAAEMQASGQILELWLRSKN